MPVMTEQQAAYLREHDLCVLGTGKQDGSSQLSMVSYLYDGAHVLCSITRDRAKYFNILRQPNVALLVPDGRAQVFVYGSVEIVDGPERDRYIRAMREAFGDPLPADYDLERFSRRLDELKRVVARITPQRVLGTGEPPA